MKHAASPSWLRRLAFALTVTGALTVEAGTPVQLRPVGFRDGRFRLQCLGEPGTAATVEVSTNLLSWERLLSTNLVGGAAELADPESGVWPRRFYRTVVAAAAGLRIVAPADGTVVPTNRPAVEIEFEGGTLDPADLKLRANGRSLPAQFLVVSNRVTCRLDEDLPDGFVTLTATRLGAVGDPALRSLVKLTVLTSARNLPPTAETDVANTTAGTAKQVAVLRNDRDPNGEALRVTGATGAAHGEVSFAASAVSYVPAPGYVGPDRFYYTIADPQGLSSTGLVMMTVTRAPALTVYVGSGASPRPAGAGPVFADLAEAAARLCDDLPPGEHGRIVLRSGTPLRVDTLSFDCDVEIEAEEGVQPRLEGTLITINSRQPLLLAGFQFAADMVQFNVGTDLSLLRNQFSGSARVALLSAPPPAPPASGKAGALGLAAPHQVSLAEVGARILEMAGPLGVGSVVNMNRLNLGAFNADSHLFPLAKFETGDSYIGDTLLRFKLEADSEFALTDRLDVGRLLFDGVLNGNATGSWRGVLAGDLLVRTSGGSLFTGHFQYVRADRGTFNYANGSVVHEEQDSFYGTLAMRLAGGALGVTTDLSLVEKQLTLTSLLNLDFGDHTRVNLGFEAGTLHETTLRANGEFQGRFLGTQWLGGVGFLASGPVGEFEFQSARFRGELALRISDNTRAGLRFDAAHLGRGAYVRGPRDNFPPTKLENSFLQYGGFFAYGAPPGAGFPIRKGASPQGGAGGGLILIRNTQFLDSQAQSAPIYLQGTHGPVVIEDNTILGRTLGISVSEVEGGVTIRNNHLTGCGIALDGDLEGSGRSGILPHPYLLERNTISTTGFLPGIAVQDLSNVTIRGNQIQAQRALMVTAGRAYAEGNTLSSFDMGAMFMMVGPAANGPGILNASGNAIIAGLFPTVALVAPGGSLRMAGHSLTGGQIMIGGEGERSFAKFENNHFSMLNLTVMGNVSLWCAQNTLTGGAMAVAPSSPDSYTLLEGNDFTEAFLSVNQPGLAVVRRNIVTVGSLWVGGSAPALLDFEGNTCLNTEVGTGEHGYARVLGNTFVNSRVVDGNSNGGLLNDPGSNAGLDLDNDISTDVDFSGNGCPDYPTGRDQRDDQGNCPEPGLPVPAAPGIAPAPAWPDFGP